MVDLYLVNLCHTTYEQCCTEIYRGFDIRLRGELVKECHFNKNRLLSCVIKLMDFVFLPWMFVLSLFIFVCERKLRSISF